MPGRPYALPAVLLAKQSALPLGDKRSPTLELGHDFHAFNEAREDLVANEHSLC